MSTNSDDQSPEAADIVVIDYQDLIQPDGNSEPLLQTIERAYGMDGIGILAIRNVPGFLQAKQELLPLAYKLQRLPKEELHKLEDPDSLFNSGWSHGKEKLRADKPDWNKASFYFNPLTDLPGTEEDRRKFPISYPANKWPKRDLLPTFETAAKNIGSLMKDVAVLVARVIDEYAHQKNPCYQPMLYDAMAQTEKAKGRLLYYYPLANTGDSKQDTSEDSWIGWHNDSGFLTTLAGDIYLTHDGTLLANSPSPEMGLYAVDRKDRVVKVDLPPDCMAVQIGECTQIVTGGAVVATPHCVRGAAGVVARTSLACFIDTPPTFKLSCPRSSTKDDENDGKKQVAGKTSARVPALEKRWKDGMTFGDFLQKTFEVYYN
jgi:isopenicillin N synthase-like dioxygenase